MTPAEQSRYLARLTGRTPQEAQQALEHCEGVMARALTFLAYPEHIREQKIKEKLVTIWLGKVPESCDICHVDLIPAYTEGGTFIDGATKFGRWAFMCPTCHNWHGVGLGTGRGQKYQRQPDGKWIKTEG